MGILELINFLAALAAASLRLAGEVQATTVLLGRMNDEGRLTLTPEEEAEMVARRDAARAALVAEIKKGDK